MKKQKVGIGLDQHVKTMVKCSSNVVELHLSGLTHKYRTSSGITLVALVITIIVLLILAGISLNLIAGSNGVLGKAKNAAEVTDITKMKEEIEMVMAQLQMDYYFEESQSGTIKEYVKSKLQEGMQSSSGATISCDENDKIMYNSKEVGVLGEDWTVTMNGETGGAAPKPVEPEDPEPIKVLATEIIKPENYGDVVNYSANGVSDWQVFLNDGNNIFLIASDYVPSSGMTITSDVSKVEGSDYKIKGNSRNGLVNWLTNTENWTAYANKISGATATGAPTKEQFCSSYNAKYGTSHSAGLADNFIVTDKVAPYIVTDTSIAYGYWAASIVSNEASKLWDVDAWGAWNQNDYNRTNYAIRPLVCLPESALATKIDNVWTFSN